MTFETAKRIKTEGYVQGQDVRTYEQLMLLNKEADAILRGGMNICEEQENGSRKYIWIKVLPTKTDEESSIELALKKHKKKKEPRKSNLSDNKVTAPESKHPITPTPTQENKSDDKNVASINRYATRLKKKFINFVKLMDEFVEE